MRVLLFVLPAMALVACGGVSPQAPEGPAVQQQVLPMAQLPDHALHRDTDYSSGYLMAEANYGLGSVQCYLPYSTVPAGQTPPTVNLAPTTATCQAIRVCKNVQGQVFILVILTDFQLSQSAIQMWVDVNGDGLPDASTRTTLSTHAGAELTAAVMDRSSGTLYVIDGLSNTVLRFADTNGDLVPDNLATPFVTGVGIRYLGEPGPNQLEIYHEQDGQWIGHPYRFLLCVDTDLDGTADSNIEQGPWGNVSRDAHAVFLELPLANQSSIKLQANPTGTWRVEVVTAGVNPILATFTATGVKQTVTLSRGLIQGETLALVEAGTGVTHGSTKVMPAGLTTITARANQLKAPAESGSITWDGRNITGLEVVEARVLGTTNWTACTVTGSTTQTLTAVVPEVGLTDTAQVEFRITTNTGPPYTELWFVEPD